jgi:hypothetical protein
MTARRARHDISDIVEPVDSTEARDQTDPVAPSERAEPMHPIVSAAGSLTGTRRKDVEGQGASGATNAATAVALNASCMPARRPRRKPPTMCSGLPEPSGRPRAASSSTRSDRVADYAQVKRGVFAAVEVAVWRDLSRPTASDRSAMLSSRSWTPGKPTGLSAVMSMHATSSSSSATDHA